MPYFNTDMHRLHGAHEAPQYRELVWYIPSPGQGSGMAKPTKPNGSREAATALAALLLLGAAPSYAINKCTDPEGHVTFTDANCPAATRHAEKISEKGFAQTSLPTNPDASQAQDAAAQGPAAHLVDANHASEAELAGIRRRPGA